MNSNDFEYINSFGVIFKDDIVIPKYNSNIPIRIDDIKVFMLVKKKSYLLKVILIIIALILSSIAFYHYNGNMKQYYVLILLLVSLILINLKKSYNYIFIIKLNDSEIKFNIDNKNKNEVKEIVSRVNKKIKSHNKSLSK